MLVIRDLVKTYSSGVQALKGVSLELHRRTLVFIQAFEWLDKAVVDRCAPVTYIKVWPFFDRLRSDPRYNDLLARLGLPL